MISNDRPIISAAEYLRRVSTERRSAALEQPKALLKSSNNKKQMSFFDLSTCAYKPINDEIGYLIKPSYLFSSYSYTTKANNEASEPSKQEEKNEIVSNSNDIKKEIHPFFRIVIIALTLLSSIMIIIYTQTKPDIQTDVTVPNSPQRSAYYHLKTVGDLTKEVYSLPTWEQNEYVRVLQRALVDAEYLNAWEVDGRYGSDTRRAFKKYINNDYE